MRQVETKLPMCGAYACFLAKLICRGENVPAVDNEGAIGDFLDEVYDTLNEQICKQ